MTENEAREMLELHKRWRDAGAKLPFPEYADFLERVRDADRVLASPLQSVEYTTVTNADGTISPGSPVR